LKERRKRQDKKSFTEKRDRKRDEREKKETG
jgi:hypothetical protein